MLNSIYEKLHQQLVEKVTLITSSGLAPLAKLAATMEAISIALIRLKEEVILHPFSTPEQEIYFFKHIKTKFYALKIYNKKRFAIQQSTPIGEKKDIKCYFEQEIKYIQHWFSQHQFYYQYHHLGATEFDSRYFMRSAKVPEIWLDDLPNLDKDFSTPMGYLFAKIRAYEQLQVYLLKEIKNLDNPGTGGTEQEKLLPKLLWTGEQVNLVELIYGIYYTGQINHGNVEVKDIITLMEVVFQIELKSPYHTFGNIRRRKSISPTAYLDKMREAINQRVEEDLAYKPNRGIKLRDPKQ